MTSKTSKRVLAFTVAGLSLVSVIGVMAEKPSVARADYVAEEKATEAVWCVSDCEKLSATLSDDLGVLVGDYNKHESSDSVWQADSIEFTKPVYLLDDKEYGLYVDFDGDNGYGVFTKNKRIYGMETEGDLEYLRETTGDVYFNHADGFLYMDADGDLHKFDEPEIEDDVLICSPRQSKEAKSEVKFNTATNYSSVQDGLRDGEISLDDFENYIKTNYSKYDKSYSYINLSNSFSCSEQWDTSYYQLNYTDLNWKENGYVSSEGNCMLNAAFNAMRNWGSRHLVSLPYSAVNSVNILSDAYYDYVTSGYIFWVPSPRDSNHRCYRLTANLTALGKMPVLYSAIRNHAVSRGYIAYGYEDNNLTVTMNHVLSTYGNDATVKLTTAAYTAFDNIEANRSCVMGIEGSATYGNHGVAVMGYYHYYRETQLSDYYKMESKYFYLIADGWNNEPVIFDPNVGSPKLNFWYLQLPRC